MVAARHLNGFFLQLIQPYTGADIHIHHWMGGYNIVGQDGGQLGRYKILIALHLVQIQTRPLKHQIAVFQKIVEIRFQLTQRYILVFPLADAESIGLACKIGVAISQIFLQCGQDICAARLVLVIKIPSHIHTSLKLPGTGG